MAEKFLEHDGAGGLRENEGLVTSAGAGDAGKIPALNGSGVFDTSFMPPGIGADTQSIVSSENLVAGDFVNVYNNAGTATVRKADANGTPKAAHGFVLAAVTSPAAATVYFEGNNNQVSGQTPGEVYLSETAGAATSTPPSASGSIVQKLGVATSATNINFERQLPVLLA